MDGRRVGLRQYSCRRLRPERLTFARLTRGQVSAEPGFHDLFVAQAEDRGRHIRLSIGLVSRTIHRGLQTPATTGLSDGRGDNHDDFKRAVFVRTNDLEGNSSQAYRGARNGSLTPAGNFDTGRRGGRVEGDPLASQGSLSFNREHDLLIGINAGTTLCIVFVVDADGWSDVRLSATGPLAFLNTPGRSTSRQTMSTSL